MQLLIQAHTATHSPCLLTGDTPISMDIVLSYLRQYHIGMNWRVSHIQSSDKGSNLNLPMVELSFKFHNSGKEEKMTISLRPENIFDIKNTLDEILSQFSTDVIKIKAHN